MKYKITPISLTDLNVENQMFAAIYSHILWGQFSKPLILCLVLKWTVCVQICWTLFNLKGKKVVLGMCSHRWTTINFDSYWWTSTSFTFLKQNPFIVHFLWTCILFELSTLDDIHTEHLMMFSTDIKKYF